MTLTVVSFAVKFGNFALQMSGGASNPISYCCKTHISPSQIDVIFHHEQNFFSVKQFILFILLLMTWGNSGGCVVSEMCFLTQKKRNDLWCWYYLEEANENIGTEAANKSQHFGDSDTNDIFKEDLGISFIKERKEAYPIRNQRMMKAEFEWQCYSHKKTQCEVAPGNKVQMQEGMMDWFRIMAALEDCRVTWLGHSPARTGEHISWHLEPA